MAGFAVSPSSITSQFRPISRAMKNQGKSLSLPNKTPKIGLEPIGSYSDKDFLNRLNRRMKELYGRWGSVYFN